MITKTLSYDNLYCSLLAVVKKMFRYSNVFFTTTYAILRISDFIFEKEYNYRCGLKLGSGRNPVLSKRSKNTKCQRRLLDRKVVRVLSAETSYHALTAQYDWVLTTKA